MISGIPARGFAGIAGCGGVFPANSRWGFPRICCRDFLSRRRLAEGSMRPRERRESGEQDLFRSRLDQVIDMKHPLVRLARTIDWGFLEATLGAVYQDG